MGKWAFKSLAELFLKNEKTPDVQIFQGLDLLPMTSLKNSARKLCQERRNNSHTGIEIFNFRENSYNSAVNTYFWAWSKFNIFANFDPLMANDGALKSSHQGKFDLGLLTGGRHNCENKLLVQSKQTVADIKIYLDKFLRAQHCLLDSQFDGH